MDENLKQFASNRWAVVGFTHERAIEIIEEIAASCGKEINRKMLTNNEIVIEFSDDTTLQHIRASESSIGYRIGKMWCDKNVNKDILYSVIRQMYFGKWDDIIWL